MGSRFLLIFTAILITIFANGEAMSLPSKNAYISFDINNVIIENQKLKQEIKAIRDSLHSASLFDKVVEQSNNEKQIEIKRQLQQQQNNLLKKEQELDKLQKKLMLLFIVTVSLLVVFIAIFIYIILKHRKNLKSSTTLAYNTLETENKYKQKNNIENIVSRIEVQEAERERISRELHDGIGGNLVAIRLLLQSIDNENPIFNELQRLVANTHKEIRTISHNLATPRLDECPFEQLFNHHISQLKTSTNILIEGILLPKQGWEKLEVKLQSEIFRLLQELTGNIIKHSRATKVNISLRLDEETISLLAEDNGIGFIVDKGYEGIGLQNIKLRVNYLNGKIDLNSTPGKGTIIMVEIPVKQS